MRVARQHAFDPSLAWGLECDPVADPERHHLSMRSHFAENAEACNNVVVEVDEFGLGQLVDVDRHQGIPLTRAGAANTRIPVPPGRS